MMNECPKCNYHNPPQAVTCRVCNLKLPRTNPPTSLLHTATRPKMAVFDLDKTLFDLSRRERAARRQGLKEGSNKWYEFLNQNKYILMDTPIPGTVNFVKQLSENGFTIAYLSGRPRHSLAATKQSLQENGFPIDATEQDLVFLHSGKGSIKNITNHKKTVLTHLKNIFDIDFFFDDTPEFREAAKSLFIPGVYPSISSYTGKEERPSSSKKKGRSKKSRKNPGHGKDLCHKTTAIDPYTGVYYACSKPEGHGGSCDYSVEMEFPDVPGFDGDNPFDNPGEKNCGCGQDPCITYGEARSNRLPRLACPVHGEITSMDDITLVAKGAINPFTGELAASGVTVCAYCGEEVKGTMVNPLPKPRKKRDKAGRMRKEPLNKYIDRFMGDKKMIKEFPDRSQRFAVAATTARKFYGDKVVDKAYPRNNPRSNPHTPVSDAKEFYKQFHQKPAKNVKKTKVDIGDTWVGLGKAWSIGYRSGKETGNETQKYIHNFGVDEESGKQFKEPDLYYVKNNDGSQMMVIMGGDWYIDVDEEGQMSWIYI